MAASPFVAVTHELSEAMARLPRRAQSLVFSCTAEALLADSAAGAETAVSAGRRFALTGDIPEDITALRAVLDELQKHVADNDVAMHDALVCADIALGVAVSDFDAREGVWYLLEPIFQATSQRLYGVTDVGSERAKHDEALALQDANLAGAINALEEVLAYLSGQPTEEHARKVCADLRVLRPLR